MRLLPAIFIFSTILPNITQAAPVEYRYSGTIITATTLVLPPGNPDIGAITDVIPDGTTYSGSFFYDSDPSSYTIPLDGNDHVSFAFDEFAIGRANINLNLVSGPATINYLGHRQSGPCESFHASGVVSTNGGLTSTTDVADAFGLGVGWPPPGGRTCADFDITGLTTGDFMPTGFAFLFVELGASNPDLIIDNNILPDDLLRLSNDAPINVINIYFDELDNAGNIIDPTRQAILIGTLDIERVAVPEPMPFALFGLGLLGFGAIRKYHRK